MEFFVFNSSTWCDNEAQDTETTALLHKLHSLPFAYTEIDFPLLDN